MLRPDVDELIAFLDTLAKLDPVAMGKLIEARVPCNKELADHPSVQVGTYADGDHEVGILGILNGWGGTIEEGDFKSWGVIAALMEPDGRCTGFCRTDSQRAKDAARPKACKRVGP